MTKGQRLKLHLKIVKQVQAETLNLPISRLDKQRIMRDRYKVLVGCETCGYASFSCALQFDHLDPATKFRDSKGNPVNPSNMVYQSITKMFDEFAKCRILCANCHAEYTHEEQRELASHRFVMSVGADTVKI